MKYYTTIVCFLVILFARFVASGQNTTRQNNDVVWDRYTNAWVKSEGRDRIEQRSIKENVQLAQLKITDVQLYIPDYPYLITPNGNKYIKAYLINNTKDSVAIDRIDATIDSVTTEIKVGNKWKLFQITMRSSCGNSYYKMKLASGNYLSLQLENQTLGTQNVPYRVIIYVNKKQKIISNETMINVSESMLSLAGSPVKRLSL